MTRWFPLFLALLLQEPATALNGPSAPAPEAPRAATPALDLLWADCALFLVAGPPAELRRRIEVFQERLKEVCREAESQLSPRPQERRPREEH